MPIEETQGVEVATARSHSQIPWNILSIHLTKVQSLQSAASSPLFPWPPSHGKGLWPAQTSPNGPPQSPQCSRPPFKNNQVFQVTPGFVIFGGGGGGGEGDSGVVWIASPYSS